MYYAYVITVYIGVWYPIFKYSVVVAFIIELSQWNIQLSVGVMSILVSL